MSPVPPAHSLISWTLLNLQQRHDDCKREPPMNVNSKFLKGQTIAVYTVKMHIRTICTLAIMMLKNELSFVRAPAFFPCRAHKEVC